MAENKNTNELKNTNTHESWFRGVIASQEEGLKIWPENGGSTNNHKYYKAVSEFIENILKPYLDGETTEVNVTESLAQFLNQKINKLNFGDATEKYKTDLRIAVETLWAFRSKETKKN